MIKQFFSILLVCSKILLFGQITTSLDSSFGVEGLKFIGAFDGLNGRYVFDLPDGKLLLGQYLNNPNTVGFSKLDTNFDFDLNFGQSGQKIIDFNVDITVTHAIQVEDSIIVSGYYYTGMGDKTSMFITKFDNEGEQDLNFGVNGLLTYSLGYDTRNFGFIRNSDGTYAFLIITADEEAEKYNAMILKTSKDFNIITTWGDNGFLEIIESQKDGFYGSIILDSQTNMIVKLTGYSSERFFKYSNLGSIDATFGTSGIKTFNYDDSQFSLTINPEEDRYEFYGELIYPSNHIPRGTSNLFTSDLLGNIDNSFGNNGYARYSIENRIMYNTFYMKDFYDNSIQGYETFDNTTRNITFFRTNSIGNLDTRFCEEGISDFKVSGSPSVRLLMQDSSVIFLLLSRTINENLTEYDVIKYIHKTGLSRNEILLNTFDIFPNPVQQTLYSNTEMTNDKKRFTIMNSVGKEVIIGTQNDLKEGIDVQNFPPGLYILNLEGYVKMKFVKL